MILRPRILSDPHFRPSPILAPAIGRLTAIGEPHRRNWKIELRWLIRFTGERGEMTFGSDHLTMTLRRLMQLERSLLRWKGFVSRQGIQTILYCDPELLRKSVKPTASRYLEGKNWKIE